MPMLATAETTPIAKNKRGAKSPIAIPLDVIAALDGLQRILKSVVIAGDAILATKATVLASVRLASRSGIPARDCISNSRHHSRSFLLCFGHKRFHFSMYTCT